MLKGGRRRKEEEEGGKEGEITERARRGIPIKTM
jgi:hypothetical protein